MLKYRDTSPKKILATNHFENLHKFESLPDKQGKLVVFFGT